MQFQMERFLFLFLAALELEHRASDLLSRHSTTVSHFTILALCWVFLR
jgi:hypothetical protein